MKIVTQKNILEKLLSNVQPYLEKKDLSQITSHILINAKTDELKILATDYEIGLSIFTNKYEVQEEGLATANGKKLIEIIKNFQDDDITLFTQDNNLIIEQNQATFSLPMFDASEFPSFPDFDEKGLIELDNEIFLKGLKKALPSTDTNNPKHELNGILINFTKEVCDIASTDTKRLAIISLQSIKGKNTQVIIPKRSATELQKILHDDSQIYLNKTNLTIKNNNSLFFTKLISGNYPDYTRIVPQNISQTMPLPKQKILETLNMIAAMDPTVSLYLRKDHIEFKSNTQSQSKAKIRLDIQTPCDEFALHVNSRYVIDFLSQVDGEEFTLHINEENLPFMLESENFRTIVMPVIL